MKHAVCLVVLVDCAEPSAPSPEPVSSVEQDATVCGTGNTVKGIAILQPKRSPEIPGLPSTAEQGLPDFDVSTWFGLFFPKGTPEPIVRRLNTALAETLDSPWVHDRFKDIVANVAPREERSPEYLKKLVDSETAKMGAAIRAAGIQQF